jgi:hypothetical protein
MLMGSDLFMKYIFFMCIPKEWNIPKDLAMDKSAWRLAINVPEP